jgi:hypothetical protein
MFGMPVDLVDTALVVGTSLPDEWLQTLDRHAGKRVAAGTSDEVLEILKP